MLKPIHTTTIYGPTLEAVKRDALAEADRITERGDNFVRVEVDKDKGEPGRFVAFVDYTKGDEAA